jgi:hypothetical protein
VLTAPALIVVGLVLHQEGDPAVFDQTGDVGPSQRVEVQDRVQPEVITVDGEAGVQPPKADPSAVFGRPQSGAVSAGLVRAAEGHRPLEAMTTAGRRLHRASRQPEDLLAGHEVVRDDIAMLGQLGVFPPKPDVGARMLVWRLSGRAARAAAEVDHAATEASRLAEAGQGS